MMKNDLSPIQEELETQYGIQIMQDAGVQFGKKSGNWYDVRFQDDTKNSSEKVYNSKKPFLKNFKDSKVYFPLTLYMIKHGLSWFDALKLLAKQYLSIDVQIKTEPPEKPKYDTIGFNFWERNKEKKHVFGTFLEHLFGDYAHKALQKYHITGNNYGQTIYWLFDQNKKIRTGQVIEYAENGKRNQVKHPYYLHTKLSNFTAQKCLFGEHLVEKSQFIGLTESPKNALICEIMQNMDYFNNFAFVGGLGAGTLTKDFLKPLTAKTVMLLPDCDIAGRIAMGVFPKIEAEDKAVEAEIVETAKNIYEQLVISCEELSDIDLQGFETRFLYQLFQDVESLNFLVKKNKVKINFTGAFKVLRELRCRVTLFDIDVCKWSSFDIADFFLSENSLKSADPQKTEHLEHSEPQKTELLEHSEPQKTEHLEYSEPQKTEHLEYSELKMGTWEGNFWKNKLNTDLVSWGNMPEQVRLEALRY